MPEGKKEAGKRAYRIGYTMAKGLQAEWLNRKKTKGNKTKHKKAFLQAHGERLGGLSTIFNDPYHQMPLWAKRLPRVDCR